MGHVFVLLIALISTGLLARVAANENEKLQRRVKRLEEALFDGPGGK